MTEILIEPFTLAHLDGLIALVAAEGWTVGFRLTRRDLGLDGADAK
jgi:hypothetical protein